ncbi:MAG: hypothetical protein E6H84_12565 [Chloroflexi bacterium]|nr:MAG: hypothetical protein E6H84_12565 [Chloroflexota bacterium]
MKICVEVRAFDFLYFSENATEPVRCSCAIAVIDGDVSHVLIEPSSSLPEIARPDLRAADLRRADQGNGGVREAGVEGGGTPRAPGATGSR